MSTQNPDPTQVAADALRRDLSGLTPEEQAEAKSLLGSIGDKWWLLLALGVITLIIGLLIVLNPLQAFNVILIFFGVYLVISGIFTIIRGFGDKLETGAKVLAIITGAISLLLGILCFRSWTDAALILILFVGISLVFRGILELVIGFSAKGAEGRGAVIFFGIVTLIIGIAFLVWPGLAGATIIYFIGFSLLVMGILEIISAFRVRAVGNRIDSVLAKV